MNSEQGAFDESVRRGARWALGSHLSGQVLSLAALAIICRLVAPEQFGVFSTALLIVTFPRTFATAGFNAVVVQRGDLRHDQLTALFWANLAGAFVCASGSVAVGWGLAWWSESPQILWLTAALSGTTVIAALGATHQGLLERQLELPRVQRARVAAQVAGALAGIAGAAFDQQAWALVAQQYVEWSLLSVLVWRCDAWRPAVRWRRESLRGLVAFGSYYSLSNLVFHLGQNFDKVLLYVVQGSTVAGQAALGMYSLAYNLAMKPVYFVTTPLSAVMLPALARSTHDSKQYAELATRFLRKCGILLFPAGVGLFVVAPEAAAVMAGENWSATGDMLQALAPLVLAQGFVNLCGSLLGSAGKSGRLLFGAVVTSLLLVQGVACGYWFGGQVDPSPIGSALGVAWGAALTTAGVFAFPYLTFALVQVRVPPRQAFMPLVSTALSAVAMGVVVWTARRVFLSDTSLAPFVRLVLLVSLGIASYAWLARRDVRWLWNELKWNGADAVVKKT